MKRALEASERVQGKDHPDTLASVAALATVHFLQGRYGEAEPLCKRALETSERILGKQHPKSFVSLNLLATLYHEQGRRNEAEPLLQRALEGYERVQGKEHPDTLISVNNLAALFREQGRYGEAEPLLQRALKVSEETLGAEHSSTLTIVHNLARLYQAQHRYGEAEPRYKRALETNERVLGKDNPETFSSISALAGLYLHQGRYNEAETLYKRAVDGLERVWGKEHPSTLAAISNLALVYSQQGRPSKAEPLFKRTLETLERIQGKEHPNTLMSVSTLGGLYFEQSDWTRAAAFWRRSTAGLAKRSLQDMDVVGQVLTGEKKSEAEQNSLQFWGLIKAVHRVAAAGGESREGAAREMFLTAQWTFGSRAAQSLAQMAARGAKGDPKLAALVRQRQDVVAEWRKRDGVRNAALGRPAEQRSAEAEAENAAQLAAIDAHVVEIDRGLATRFPDYATFANPEPISVEGVQQQLGADEAVVLFLDTPEAMPTPEETFVWVVSKTEMRWVRSSLGKATLAREVQALRCGLDYTAWRASRCKDLTGVRYAEADFFAGRPLPFDHGRSHKLYKSLFGEVEGLIKGKHLLIVPSGALAQLPFQVLVTEPPASGDHKSIAWLVRDHAITVLPSASSLKALRRMARSSAASKPMIGFGNRY